MVETLEYNDINAEVRGVLVSLFCELSATFVWHLFFSHFSYVIY